MEATSLLEKNDVKSIMVVLPFPRPHEEPDLPSIVLRLEHDAREEGEVKVDHGVRNLLRAEDAGEGLRWNVLWRVRVEVEAEERATSQ